MKRSSSCCVSAISLVSASWGSLSSASSCGLSWMMRMPKTDPSSCIARYALAKRCCSGDRLEIASRNSVADGSASSISGMSTASLFCRMRACFCSKVPAGPIRPSSSMKEENCRARAPSMSTDAPELVHGAGGDRQFGGGGEGGGEGGSPNWCARYACTKRSPVKLTRVAASSAKLIGATGSATRRQMVWIAPLVWIAPRERSGERCSMVSVPSG
mmetsp:Transcript_4082/g.12818  ORF Transcript_4082/g.12818 Transcript_4082/m.12818 type:complete len:215 (+) Transcript_4082:1385-2029(+)